MGNATNGAQIVIDVESLQHCIDVQQSVGFLKSKLDIKKYVDMSFVRQAVDRIKNSPK